MKHGRMVAIAAAVVAAGVVLLVSLLAGPDAPPTRDGLTPEQIAELELDTQFNPDATGDVSRPTVDPTMGHVTEQGQWTFTDPDTGRVTRVYWDHLTPRSRFVYDMTRPVMRVIFSPARILEITADQGEFQLGDRQDQLQRGRLLGDVAVRLMETDDGSDVDLHSDRDVQLHLTLGDEAEFDTELGELISEQLIRVTGPRVDFQGRGLSLRYNRLRDRIDQLVIDREVRLRLKSEPPTAARRRPRAQGAGASRPARAAREPDDVATPPAAEAKPTPAEPRPVQFYRARFEESVVVDATERDTHMTGDYLEATFTFQSRDPTAPAEPPAKRASARRPAEPSNDSDSDTRSAPASEPPPTAPSTPGQVVITCAGRLIMEPLDDPEPAMLADPEAVLLALVGTQQSATILTGDGETITGQRVDYLTTTGRIRAAAGDDGAMPMRLASAQTGEVTGRALMIDPATRVGQVRGPGSLITRSQDAADETDLPLHITWRDRLDLTFFAAEPGRADAHAVESIELLGIRTAAFHGDTRVEHPEFQLSSDMLTAHADRPDPEADARLTGIDAEGHVRMTAQRPGDQQALMLAAQRMRIDVTLDDAGREQPTRLLAEGEVVAEQAGMILHSGALDARLGMVAEEPEQPPRLSVTHMTATGGVDVQVDDPPARLLGERMTVNALTRQMELFAAAGSYARVLRDDAELTGPQLVMDEMAQTIHVVGPGVFTFHDTPPEEAALEEIAERTPDAAPPVDSREPTTITVTWTESMHFDQVNSYAHFVGDVASAAETASDQTWLTCQDLRLDFERDTAAAAGPRNLGAIRTATARGEPVLKSRSFDPADPDADLTRFRLEGPLMTFENTPNYELAQVIGPGRMLVEDYRPADPSPTGNRPSPIVQVSGKGQTLFTWQKQLTLDAARNDMLMEQTVRMVHRPLGRTAGAFGEVVTLACEKLLADLSDSQGMDGWLSESAPRPNIHMIVADRAVKLTQGDRQAYCDRLIYLGESDEVQLTSARGGRVRILDASEPTPLTGRAFRWKLGADQFELIEPGAVTAPLPQ